MSTSMGSGKQERPNTYMVQDKKSGEELTRLAVQDRLVTSAMGGVLTEQADPARFQRVLDVACGTGGWIIDAAQAYATMTLFGIDISQRLIEYAREQAKAAQVGERVTFRVMDALLMLAFPSDYFDLTNLRYGVSFLRTWEWPKLLGELLRVTSSGGIIRITDIETQAWETGPAITRLYELFTSALHKAGHLYEAKPNSLTSHLPGLLQQYGCKQVQTRSFSVIYQAGTPEGEACIEDIASLFRTVRPFIQKWGSGTTAYDTLYQQALEEMQQPDFSLRMNFLTAWGTRP